jgi:hypothetical protein
MAELISRFMGSLEIRRLLRCFGVKEARRTRSEAKFLSLEQLKEIVSMGDFMCMGKLGLISTKRNLYFLYFKRKNLNETPRLTLKSLNEI